jgi:hypothetical protein
VVSKFYLRHFADENDILMTVALPDERTFKQSINDASVCIDYYTVLDSHGNTSDAAEAAFGTIETAASHAWEAVIGGEWPLGGVHKESLARWVALHFLRSDRVRASMSDIASGLLQLEIMLGGRIRLAQVLAEAGDPCDQESVDEAWVELFKYPISLVPHANHHVGHIFDLIAPVTESLLDRFWLLTKFERKALITSDSPVSIVSNARDQAIGLGTGVETADAIGVPLTRRLHLSLARRASLPAAMATLPDFTQAGSSKTALYSNDVTARSARKYLYHHPKDAPLTGMAPPPPRSREIGGTGDAWRFMSVEDRQVLIDAGVTPPPSTA